MDKSGKGQKTCLSAYLCVYPIYIIYVSVCLFYTERLLDGDWPGLIQMSNVEMWDLNWHEHK